MRFVTQETYEREVTSWENIYYTKRNNFIEARSPTIEELRANYLKTNKIVRTFMVLPRTGEEFLQG